MTATNVNLFGFHKLNTQGQQKALAIADVFENALAGLESICPVATREFSITKTKMEEACFFAKKAMGRTTGESGIK